MTLDDSREFRAAARRSTLDSRRVDGRRDARLNARRTGGRARETGDATTTRRARHPSVARVRERIVGDDHDGS